MGCVAVTAESTIDRPQILGVSRGTALMIVIALVHLVLAWVVRTPGFGWGEDDATFFLLARDLQSFHYRDIHDVLAPVHARFPPVFPAMLALVGKVTGNRLDVMLAFVGLCSAVSIVLFFDAARRSIGEDIALLMVAVYAINHTALSDAGSLMSEAPFKMFIALALWGASRDESARYAAVAVAGVVLAALTRSAGVVFLPALGAYWLLKRRYAWFLGLAAASLLVVAWLWFTFNAPDADHRRLYVADLRGTQENMFDALARRLERIVPRARRYLTTMIPWTISVPTIPGTIVDNVVWLLLFLVLGLLGMLASFRRWTLAAFFLVAYGGLVLVWRFLFERLVQPIVPLIFAMMLLGCTVALRKYPRYRFAALLTLSGLLAIGALQRTVPQVAERLACDRSAPADSESCWPGPEREFLALANWVRDSTPSDAVFLVSKERTFYVQSGRKTINQDRAHEEDSASIGGFLRSRGVTFTVLTPVGILAKTQGELLGKSCRDFDLVRQFTARTMLFRVRPEPSASDSTAACEATRAYAIAVGQEP